MGLSFYLLSSIMIHDHNDTCSWPLDPSNYFAVKSLMTALMNNPDCPTSSLYKVIWSDSYTKMIKIFSFILELLTQQINFIDIF